MKLHERRQRNIPTVFISCEGQLVNPHCEESLLGPNIDVFVLSYMDKCKKGIDVLDCVLGGIVKSDN